MKHLHMCTSTEVTQLRLSPFEHWCPSEPALKAIEAAYLQTRKRFKAHALSRSFHSCRVPFTASASWAHPKSSGSVSKRWLLAVVAGEQKRLGHLLTRSLPCVGATSLPLCSWLAVVSLEHSIAFTQAWRHIFFFVSSCFCG